MVHKKNNRKKKKGSRKKQIMPSYVIVSLFLMLFAFFGTLSLLVQAVSLNPIPDNDQNEEQEQFIEQTAEYAKKIQEEYGILPSISISQAILESDWGNSRLSTESNNLYGIKGSDPENTVVMQTKEFVDGQWIEIEAPFRKYDDWRESMDDHARLFVEGTSWNSEQYASVLSSSNYREAAYALQSSGYATDPEYSEKLIRLIEEYELHQYD